jgi:hypothetical protein
MLKGTDLTFDIGLEKTEYRPGEIVRGMLTIKTEKSSKLRQLMLFAEGKESTMITVSESTGSGSRSRHSTTRTYSEINKFFSKDLSPLLQESISSNILQDGTLEILPQNKQIAFDFNLPTENSLFSSYKGKHANITYAVKATADIAKKFDVNKEEQFSIINLNHNKIVFSSDASFDAYNKSDIIDTPTIEKENNISPSPILGEEEEGEDTVKESYSARFEQIFGKKANRTPPDSRPRPRYFTSRGTSIDFDLGTVFAKGREHFLKESSEAKINLLNRENNNSAYSPGHTVNGEVILLIPPIQEEEEENKNNNKKIRGMKITLSGIEHAFAQGLQRVNTIEKYEKNIELKGNENGRDNGNTIQFEFHIPEDVNQSYIGKYSEYFWGLEAKVNIAWSSDINARTIIEVV